MGKRDSLCGPKFMMEESKIGEAKIDQAWPKVKMAEYDSDENSMSMFF